MKNIILCGFLISTGWAHAKPVDQVLPLDRVIVADCEVAKHALHDDIVTMKVVRIYNGSQKAVGRTFEIVSTDHPPAVINFPSAYIRSVNIGERGLWALKMVGDALIPVPYSQYDEVWPVFAKDKNYPAVAEKAALVAELSFATDDSARLSILKRVASKAENTQHEWASKILKKTAGSESK